MASEVHPDGVAGVPLPISVASIQPPDGTVVRDTVPVAEETTPPIAGVAIYLTPSHSSTDTDKAEGQVSPSGS